MKKEVKDRLVILIRLFIMLVYTGICTLGLVGSAHHIIRLQSYYSAIIASAGLGLIAWVMLVLGYFMFGDIYYYFKALNSL